MKVVRLAMVTAVGLAAGCAAERSGTGGAVERGPQGTIAYEVQVETSEPGIRIEANNEYVGTTPLTLKVFGDKDGTFHNFGTFDYIVRALPAKPGQYPQTKIFRTGGYFMPEDRIPKRIFFEMTSPPGILLTPPPTGQQP